MSVALCVKMDFNNLKGNCLSSEDLFVDSLFPPSALILSAETNQKVQWKRPKELCDKPRFVIDDVSTFAVKQRFSCNRWFFAVIETLTQNREVFEKVMPLDQTFDSDYAGIFRFRFWRNGEWKEIVIDDRLPTVDGELVYMKAPDCEFWPALLEKAYAKFYGSYGAIKTVPQSEAIVDFASVIVESIRLQQHFTEVLKQISISKEAGAIVTASINRINQARLIYSVMKVDKVMTIQGAIDLILLKNPWGHHGWTGTFSESSLEWNLISNQDQERLVGEIKDDGDFHLKFEDFLKYFDQLEIGYLNPDALKIKTVRKSFYEGTWTDSKLKSPQIFIEVQNVNKGSLCTIIVDLLHRRDANAEQRKVNFEIFKVTSEDFKSCFIESQFLTRDKSIRNNLPDQFQCQPGFIVIVPSIDPAPGGEFLLRVNFEERETILRVNEGNRKSKEIVGDHVIDLKTANNHVVAKKSSRDKKLNAILFCVAFFLMVTIPKFLVKAAIKQQNYRNH